MDTALQKLKFIAQAMDPSQRRSTEWKNMKNAFTNPPANMSKAQQLQYAHECITKYMKGKKSLRSDAEERDRFDQSLDGLAVLAEVGPLAKAKTDKLVNRINHVRTHRPLAWQKNQPTVSEADMAERAGKINRFYAQNYSSSAKRIIANKGGAQAAPFFSGVDFLRMGREEAVKIVPQDLKADPEDAEFFGNILGDLDAHSTKKEYLATMLATEKVSLFRNELNDINVSKKELKKAVDEITGDPGFDDFVEKFDDEKIANMKKSWDHLDNFNQIKEEYQKHQNPEIQKGL